MKSLRTTTHRNNLSKKWLIIAGALLLLAVSAVAGYYTYSRSNDTNKSNAVPTSSDKTSERTVNYEAPSQDEQAAGEAQKEQTVNGKPDLPSSGDQTTPSSTLGVTFTVLNQNGATVQIRSLISQIISGTCTLTVSQGATTKTYTAATQADASSSTCKGFDIPVSDLGAGMWSIKLSVQSSDNKKGDATTSMEVK